MTDKEQKKAAAAFAKEWAGKGNEEQDAFKFWVGFIRRVLGVEDAENHIEREKPVKYKGHTTKIDIYIPETNVLIEQKNYGVDLDKKEPRHGEMLTPFEQAEQYSQKLIRSEKARYIIVSNFETFRIHDLDKLGYESTYEEIKLCDLEKECHRFGFIIDKDKQIFPCTSKEETTMNQTTKIQVQTTIATVMTTAALITTQPIVTTAAETTTHAILPGYVTQYGDVNLDQEVSVMDVLMLQRYMLGLPAEIENWKNADLDKDGVLDIYDLAILKRGLTHNM